MNNLGKCNNSGECKTGKVYEFCMNFKDGDYIEIMKDWYFHQGSGGFNSISGKGGFLLPKGSLLRVDLLSQYWYVNFSILKKYNPHLKEEIKNKNIKVGKYCQSLFNLTGLTYKIIKNIDSVVNNKKRIEKIDKVLN